MDKKKNMTEKKIGMRFDRKKVLINLAFVILILMALLFFIIGIKMYLSDVDRKARKLLDESDTTFIPEDNLLNYRGFYVANVKEDILDFAYNKKIESVTYVFPDETFYIDFVIEEDKDGDKIVSLKKIVDKTLNISARMNTKDIESIEYRTGNIYQSTVLKINTSTSSNYFAMIDGTYYFLGSDIESITYLDGQFYYTSYNQDYLYIEEAKSCSSEVQELIDGFKMSDYYYKYGKINFLEEYYQKLPSKTYRVKDKCSEFETEDDKENE